MPLVPPHTTEAALMDLAFRRAILEIVRVDERRAAAGDLAARLVPKDLQEDMHDEATQDAHTENSDHDVVALAELVWSRSCIFGPPSVERVGRSDASQVP